MSNKDEEKIIENVTNRYKAKSYKEISEIIENVQCLNERYKNKSYFFEIHAYQASPDKINVCIEYSRGFLISFSNRQEYFSSYKNGNTIDITGDEYYRGKTFGQ